MKSETLKNEILKNKILKKIFFLLLPVFLITAFAVFNPPAVADTGAKVIKITERLFIAQTNDIYINAQDYLGKTISYEGIYKAFKNDETDETFHCVIRYGPGCCANDGEAGFEVRWDGGWPKDNDWCEVSGILEEYQINGIRFLRLALTSLKVLEKRGAETVKT